MNSASNSQFLAYPRTKACLSQPKSTHNISEARDSESSRVQKSRIFELEADVSFETCGSNNELADPKDKLPAKYQENPFLKKKLELYSLKNSRLQLNKQQGPAAKPQFMTLKQARRAERNSKKLFAFQ